MELLDDDMREDPCDGFCAGLGTLADTLDLEFKHYKNFKKKMHNLWTVDKALNIPKFELNIISNSFKYLTFYKDERAGKGHKSFQLVH